MPLFYPFTLVKLIKTKITGSWVDITQYGEITN